MLKLEFPSELHEQLYNDMLHEWKTTEKTPTSPRRLFSWKDFQEFLSIVKEDLISSAPKVPSHLFFLIDSINQKILWAIQIRHHINHPNLIENWGHIGYWVRPSERGKGYATEMLKLSLEKAKELWLEKILLTCDDDNIGSWTVIEANGGIFERFTQQDWIKVRRYWILIV